MEVDESGPVAGMLHADLDAFFASVEQRDDPALRDRAMCVGAGVVLAASYEARRVGVRTAMSLSEARRRCPEMVVVDPRMDAYAEASRAVMAIFEDTTPLVEPLSIDEAFLDVRGLRRLRGPAPEIAAALRSRVADEVGLALSVGVARTKFLAKVASGCAKPDGLLVVPIGTELDFLHPLDIRRLWGVGPATAARLRDIGVHTVGQVAALPVEALIGLLGPGTGRHLHALAHDHDPRQVVVGRRRSSIGAQRALGRGRTPAAELDSTLVGLCDRVAERLRAGRRVGRVVTLRTRFGDLSSSTRSRTLVEATDRTDELLAVARRLLAERADELARQGCTLLGVTIADLSDADAVQLSLDLDGHDRRSLDRAVDAVRGRFGSGAVRRASGGRP